MHPETEEFSMATMLKTAKQRAAMTAKEERTRDAALAMQEYEAEKLAVRTKTAPTSSPPIVKRSREQAMHEQEGSGESGSLLIFFRRGPNNHQSHLHQSAWAGHPGTVLARAHEVSGGSPHFLAALIRVWQ